MKAINEFSNEALEVIFPNGNVVRGNTYPVTVTIKDDGVAHDITGYALYVSFHSTLTCEDTPDVQADIPITDAAGGIFSGFVTDDDTYNLNAGNTYVSIKYIDDDGHTFIFDMAKIKVVNCVNSIRA